ncbi:hypothetical protein AVEN_244438-1 [Araneus ventricosus]|uniref:Uncharacterized protein n=1 Tax=Araneus ventricosus TaxID=182803 RepID=A0A4Y2WK51_ARAVE|nr:hypothetical protein AVEN_244438-1 [Araneus ventricosus]
MGNKRLISFKRQCSTTSRSNSEKVPCQTQCYHSGTPSLFSRPSTSGFLPISTAENEIEETSFVDSDEVIEKATKQLKDLSKNGFLDCFEQLYERWKKCVDAGVKYFECQ